jgi:hypothetical protein
MVDLTWRILSQDMNLPDLSVLYALSENKRFGAVSRCSDISMDMSLTFPGVTAKATVGP